MTIYESLGFLLAPSPSNRITDDTSLTHVQISQSRFHSVGDKIEDVTGFNNQHSLSGSSMTKHRLPFQSIEIVGITEAVMMYQTL